MTLSKILILIGVICFVLAAFEPSLGVSVGWFPLGWAFVVAGYLLVDS